MTIDGHPSPHGSWLATPTPTKNFTATTDSSIGFSIDSDPFEAGSITPGGNRMPGESGKSMFKVLIEELPWPPQASSKTCLG